MAITIPHTLGLDLVQQSDLFVHECLEGFEEHFTWLDEILETAKAAFQSSQLQVLPKTPSARQRRIRNKRSELPSFIRRSSNFTGRPLCFFETYPSTCNDENVPPDSESDDNVNHSYTKRSTRQKTVQIAVKPRKQPARGISKTCSTSSKNNQVSEAKDDRVSEAKNDRVSEAKNDQVSEAKNDQVSDASNPEAPAFSSSSKEPPPSLQTSSTNTKESEAEIKSPVPSCSKPDEISPNQRVTPTASPVESEHRVDNSSYVIKKENTSLEIPKIDVSPKNRDNPQTEECPKIQGSSKTEECPKIQGSSKTEECPKSQGSPKTEECPKIQDSPKTEECPNKQDASQTADAPDCEEHVHVKTRRESDSGYEVTSEGKISTTSSCNSELTHEAGISVTSSSSASSLEVQRASSPTKPRTRTRRMHQQAKVAATALKDSSQTAAVATADEATASRPCTRSRARKRMSEEVENVYNAESKRHCTKEEKDRLSNGNVGREDQDDDADVEDSDEDESEAKIETLINVYTAPSTHSTPKQNGIHSFLLNSSYSLANRSFNKNDCSLRKYIRTGALTGSAQKHSTHSRLNMLASFGNFKSYLKKTSIKSVTPIKSIISQEMKKRELENKQRKDRERLMMREEIQRLKLEEQKKKREERMRKVAEARQIRDIREQEKKDKSTRKLEERFNSTDRFREVKLQEERERQRFRIKKQQEAEERRKMEEKERSRKLKEQEEHQMRHQSMLQRKKEFEEQERLKKVAEEKRKLEEQKERKLEAEREKIIDLEKRKRLEEEREKERLCMKAEREKELAKQRAEREHYLKEKQKKQELALEKIREMERERLVYEQSLQEKKLEKDERIERLVNTQPLSQAAGTPLNTTITIEKPDVCSKDEEKVESYEITPHRSSYNSYDIDDLKSDDSTDEETNPQKPIPKWAQGPSLKIALYEQYYNPPNLDNIFPPVEIPDLNAMFTKKKARFNHRSSSAHWDAPILRSHLPIFH